MVKSIKMMISYIKNLFKLKSKIDYDKPHNWSVGDFVQCIDSVDGQYTKGEIYCITRIDLRVDFWNINTQDVHGNNNGWGIEYFRFYFSPNYW